MGEEPDRGTTTHDHGAMTAGEATDDPRGGPLAVVLNSSAGMDRRGVEDRIGAALSEAGVAANIDVLSPHELEERLAMLRDTQRRTIAVAGGDGTMLTAAALLAGSMTALLPLPTGTLNHFARRLGLHDLESAAAAARDGATAAVPVGIVDDLTFLNTATFGLYADMVRRRERLRKLLRKWPAAAVSFAVTLTRLHLMDVTLVVDGERLERRTSLVWIGVGWGSFPLVHEAPRQVAQPDLEIVILKPTGPFRSLALLLRLSFRVQLGKQPIRDGRLEILHAQQLLIHGQHRIGVTLDGEALRIEPPIFIAIQDEALRVVTPSAKTAATPSGENLPGPVQRR